MTEQLQISLLGAPEIRRDGQPISGFTHRKSLALICYLAVTGRPHSRASLAGLLWGDATDANARGGLRKSLAELRQEIGSYLLITRHDVTFKPDASLWLDVTMFDREAEALQKAHGQGLTPADASALIEAVALYRDELLAGFHVLRAQAFEEWLLLARERLRLSALRMTYALSIHFLTQADYSQAITYAEQVLTLESCHEEAHRLLMSLLALSGNQSAALRQYHVCRQALNEELGLDPDEETIALYERIHAGSSSGEKTTPLPPQLERPSLPLIGRQKELDDILNHLQNTHCRLLTLFGPGGSGKTHLAREIAAKTLAQAKNTDVQRQKVYLVSLGLASTIRSIIPAIAQGAGFYFAQESHPRRQLLSYMRRQQALLILDACEGLLDLYEPDQGSFVDLIEEILDVAPGITILATSRARLNLPSETLYPMAGMNYPEQTLTSVDLCLQFDAVQLFLWRLERVQPNHNLGSEDLLAIADICRFAKGMPLEILLMANWARLLDPPTIIDQLLGTTESASAAAQPLMRDLQRNLTPVFDHSWRLLGKSERNTLVTISVFRSGFTYERVHEISGISHPDLMRLIDQSIINPLDIPTHTDTDHKAPLRYDMHDLLREYVGSKSDLAPILSGAHEQHSTYFIGELQNWADSLLGAREQETLQTMDMEIANVRAAWEWAASHGRTDLLDQGLDGICRYFQKRFRYAEGEAACQTSVRALSVTPAQQRLLAKALAWQSWFTQDHDQALDRLGESLRILDELSAAEDVRVEKALALHAKGYHLAYTDHKQGRRVLEESLAVYQQLDDDWHTAKTLNQLYIQSWKSGEYEEGKIIAKKCLDLYRRIGYLKGYAAVLGDQGISQLQAGLVDEGMQSIQESIDIFEQLGDRAGIVKGLYFSGMALGFTGQWQEAEKRLGSCLSIGEDHCNFFDTILIAMAIVKTHRGQYDQARRYAHDGLEVATELDNQMCIGRAHSAMALAALGEGAPHEASAHAQTAVTVYRSFGQNTELGLALAAQGYAACQNGTADEAQTNFNEALNLAAAYKDQLSLLYAFVGVAYLLVHQGMVEQAIESYAAAARHPVVAKSYWFQDIVKKRIDEAASALPPETIAAAIARGQAIDLASIAQTILKF